MTMPMKMMLRTKSNRLHALSRLSTERFAKIKVQSTSNQKLPPGELDISDKMNGPHARQGTMLQNDMTKKTSRACHTNDATRLIRHCRVN